MKSISGLKGIQGQIDTKNPTLGPPPSKSVAYLACQNATNSFPFFSIGYEWINGASSAKVYMEAFWGPNSDQMYSSHSQITPSSDPLTYEISIDSSTGIITAKYNGSTWSGSTTPANVATNFQNWNPSLFEAAVEWEPLSSHVVGTPSSPCNFTNLAANVSGTWTNPNISGSPIVFNPTGFNGTNYVGISLVSTNALRFWDKR